MEFAHSAMLGNRRTCPACGLKPSQEVSDEDVDFGHEVQESAPPNVAGVTGESSNPLKFTASSGATPPPVPADDVGLEDIYDGVLPEDASVLQGGER